MGNVVTENANKGTDGVQNSISYALTANVENLTLTGTSAINGTGNVLNNLLTGKSAANTLTGGAGNDTLNGLAGDKLSSRLHQRHARRFIPRKRHYKGKRCLNTCATRTVVHPVAH